VAGQPRPHRDPQNGLHLCWRPALPTAVDLCDAPRTIDWPTLAKEKPPTFAKVRGHWTDWRELDDRSNGNRTSSGLQSARSTTTAWAGQSKGLKLKGISTRVSDVPAGRVSGKARAAAHVVSASPDDADKGQEGPIELATRTGSLQAAARTARRGGQSGSFGQQFRRETSGTRSARSNGGGSFRARDRFQGQFLRVTSANPRTQVGSRQKGQGPARRRRPCRTRQTRRASFSRARQLPELTNPGERHTCSVARQWRQNRAVTEKRFRSPARTIGSPHYPARPSPPPRKGHRHALKTDDPTPAPAR